MKKLLIGCLVLSLLGSYGAFAQFSTGTQFLGATIAAQGTDLRSKPIEGTTPAYVYNQHALGLGLQWGVFTKENFMFGLGINGQLKPRSVNSERQLEFSYGASPFVRWYKPVAGKFSVFIEPSLGVSFYNRTQKADGFRKSDPLRTSFSLGAKPGISYQLGRRFALESDLNLFYLGLNFSENQGNRNIRFVSSMSSNITSYFTLRGAFYLN